MNTSHELFKLLNSIQSICNKNQGIITITFFDNTKVIAKLKSVNTNFTTDNGFRSTITVFFNDINDTKTYDMFQISEIS